VCFSSLRQLRSVWRSLPRHALLTLVRAFVVCKVDYCISVLAGVSGNLRNRLQSVLNAATRLICSARKSEHITPLLWELHWLRVPERTQFRLCSGLPLCARHSASLPSWQPPAYCQCSSTPSSAFHRHHDAASATDATFHSRRPGISSGSSSSLESAAACNTCRQLAAAVPATDKSISVPVIILWLTRSRCMFSADC